MTAAQVRSLVQDVVEAHATHNHFYPDWEVVKDRPTVPEFPCVLWQAYGAKLPQDEIGWKRTELVRLMVITSVPTDRSPEELQEAVEAADQAAVDIVLKIAEDHASAGVEVSNVSITPMHDEYTQLLSGVVLTFTVSGAHTCLDDAHFNPGGSCEPATITINGAAYGDVNSGATEDIEVVDQDGNPIGSLVSGQWVVTIPEEVDNILPYANEASALADDTTIPATNQLVVITDTGRTYWGDGASDVAALVNALKYILPVTEVPADKLLRVDAFGEVLSIQMNS